MKNKYVVIILLMMSVCFFACSKSSVKEMDLIIVAGQSNAVGYDANADELAADSSDKQVLFWWRCGDPVPDQYDSTSHQKWTHLQAQPKGNPNKTKGVKRQYGNFRYKAGFGPEMGLARKLMAEEGKEFAIVKVAFSGTSVSNDWNPSDAGSRGACYRSLIAETKAAIQAAKEKNIHLRLRAMLWVQGESDANERSAARYAKDLAAMIESLRYDLQAPQFTVLLALNTHFNEEKNIFVPKIIEAQKEVAKNISDCVYVDTSKAEVANKVHFSSKGTLEIGVQFAEALMKKEKSLLKK